MSDILEDYRLCYRSRMMSLIGRQEVFSGRARFGIFGDGKELPQLILSKFFQKGDFRSGYYRDQTLMLGIGQLTPQQFFAQLYAHNDIKADPASGGRMMNNHFGTRMLDRDGNLIDLTKSKNSTSDVSCNAAQMPKLLGLGYASKLFKHLKSLHKYKTLSNKGNEIAFGTIGNAATSEGMFFETINAAGVLQVPILISIWDDEYGISVPNIYHTPKSSISQVLEGFRRDKVNDGIEIFKVKGYEYKNLFKTYQKATEICRNQHIPVVVHVTELTQPQGHSTSGSHERYKSKKRLLWEKEYDCIAKLKEYILKNYNFSEKSISKIEEEETLNIKEARDKAWFNYTNNLTDEQKELKAILIELSNILPQDQNIKELISQNKNHIPHKSILYKQTKNLILSLSKENVENNLFLNKINSWLSKLSRQSKNKITSNLYSETTNSALNIHEVKPTYNNDSKIVNGHIVLNTYFDHLLKRDDKVFFLGQDIGKIGDVNQGLAGMQNKYGELRVTDTSIRECTMVGQGIGCAIRGLKPIVEIQYLDYLPYALQIISDDLATLRYRTAGGQKAPMIIRTRGHRLEGIWHSGSYISSIINSCRGVYLCVPRNMVEAAGFYNTFINSDDPAIIIERLNAYRLKEKLPKNLKDIKTPIGIPEILLEGHDITIVTYGPLCDIAIKAAKYLYEFEIYCEIIDVRTLLPFDINGIILQSIKKTNKIIFLDEDVPGGTTAYMMDEIIVNQNGFHYLDCKPKTITSQPHRPAYGLDGDYFSKPNEENIVDAVMDIMSDYDPKNYRF